MAIVAIYVIARVVVPATWPKAIKWLVSIAIFFGIQRLPILRYLLGANTDLTPVWLNTALTCFHISIVCLAILCILVDLFYLLRYLFNGCKRQKHRFSSVLLLVVGLALGTHAYYAGTKVPDIRLETVKIKDLNPDLQGLKLAVLTDLHLGTVFDAAWMEQVVARTQAAKPDLIFVLGDVVDGNPKKLASYVAPLSKLKAPYGQWMVVGNHEYYSGYNSWLPVFESLGLRVLLNTSAEVKVKNTEIVVVGVTDPVASQFGLAEPDLDLALEATAHSKGLRILLAHQPILAEQANQPAKNIQLQLSGHTHGGSLLPLIPVVRAFNKGFVGGWYELENIWLYVSRGAGLWAGLPMRLGVPSEITIITLEKAS